jgi:Mlc titration factor MtfA (ptsG expression regulator)
MLFDWLLAPVRHFQRRALLAEPFPEAWLPVLAALPFYRRLDPRGQQRIRDDLRVLIAEKNWEGCGGLVLTDEMRVTIAAQASLLLLNIEHDYFVHVKSILVYPSTYVHGGQQILGEAWFRGPVVLAWDSARHGAFDPRDGHNLVLHEFAHQLDLLDGLGDGTPPIRGSERYRQWVATMTAEFQALCDDFDEGRATLLDVYGATNPAEFFAVATESFFERSTARRERHASLYAVLHDYYQQDRASMP